MHFPRPEQTFESLGPKPKQDNGHDVGKIPLLQLFNGVVMLIFGFEHNALVKMLPLHTFRIGFVVPIQFAVAYPSDIYGAPWQLEVE
jgi:hypothetical protein